MLLLRDGWTSLMHGISTVRAQHRVQSKLSYDLTGYQFNERVEGELPILHLHRSEPSLFLSPISTSSIHIL